MKTDFDVLGYCTDYDDGDKPADINEIIEFLTNAKNKGATHVMFTGLSNYQSETEIIEVDMLPLIFPKSLKTSEKSVH